MDKAALVAPDADRIARGDELLRELNEAGFPVHRALWWYSSDRYGDWRLVIASPLVDQTGPLAAYKKLDAVLRKRRPDLILWLKSVHLVSPKEPLIRDLDKTYVRGQAPVGGINLTASTAGSTYIEQAHLYWPHGTTE
jgi:hypothetical protein